jgi:hypothetical protein
MDGHEILGFLDILGALVMVLSNQKITRRAGIATRLQQWALVRRCIYLLTAMALFVLGIKRFELKDAFDPSELWAQVVILLYIIVFPLLRAFGWITQDMLIDDYRTSDRSDKSRSISSAH